MPVAVIDLDGVIADFTGGFSAAFGESPPVQGSWDFYEEWGWSRRKWIRSLDNFTNAEGFLHNVGPLDCSWEDLRRDFRKLRRAGFDILFATHRPAKSREQTLQWLGYVVEPPFDLRLISSHEPKCENLPPLGGPLYVIDDSPMELERWVSSGRAQSVSRRIQPWNEGAPGSPVASFSEWVYQLTEMVDDDGEIIDDPMPTTRHRVLMTADQLVNGDRNNQYGPPSQDFSRTAAIWTAIFGGKQDARGRTVPFEAHDVALGLVAVKMSRITWDPRKLDHWVDGAGYFSCGADAWEETSGVEFPE